MLCEMTSGSELKTSYQDGMAMWVSQQKIIGYLLKLYYIDIALAARGEIYPLDLEIFEWYTPGLVDGQKQASGSKYSNIWQPRLIMNMP
jgi:hypothetical protein